jgi:ElaB/YqjD/DUF883 family membrane-anchored ribosome-binding protein
LRSLNQLADFRKTERDQGSGCALSVPTPFSADCARARCTIGAQLSLLDKGTGTLVRPEPITPSWLMVEQATDPVAEVVGQCLMAGELDAVSKRQHRDKDRQSDDLQPEHGRLHSGKRSLSDEAGLTLGVGGGLIRSEGRIVWETCPPDGPPVSQRLRGHRVNRPAAGGHWPHPARPFCTEHDVMSDTQRQINQLRAQVEALMRERVTPAVADVAGRADTAMRRGREQVEAVSGRVQEWPLLAILVAVGIGYLLGRFLSP